MKHILIVDDAPDSRLALSRLLRTAGYDTSCAKDGSEGLTRLREDKPDLVLLDQLMPQVDGLTLLANMRRFPRFRDVPVIMFSGNGDPACANRARSLGVKEYCRKADFTPPQLLARIEALVSGPPNEPSPA